METAGERLKRLGAPKTVSADELERALPGVPFFSPPLSKQHEEGTVLGMPGPETVRSNVKDFTTSEGKGWASWHDQLLEDAIGKDTDMVNSPPHYNATGYETIDLIRQALGDEEFIIGCRWQVLKYAIRAPYKGKHDEDMAKAAWYARMASGDDPRLDKS